jgi:hypothetical protein
MQSEKNQESNAHRREPESWVPEEHVITESYPVFPTHGVAYPHINGQADGELNVSHLVNKACHQVALSHAQVIGGRGRKKSSMVAVSYSEIECSLASFAPLHSSSAYETLMAILDEYPRNEGTDHLRKLIDATPTAYCRACGAEFNVRLLHACTPRDLSRNGRQVAEAYRALDRALGSRTR